MKCSSSWFGPVFMLANAFIFYKHQRCHGVQDLAHNFGKVTGLSSLRMKASLIESPCTMRIIR